MTKNRAAKKAARRRMADAAEPYSVARRATQRANTALLGIGRGPDGQVEVLDLAVGPNGRRPFMEITGHSDADNRRTLRSLADQAVTLGIPVVVIDRCRRLLDVPGPGETAAGHQHSTTGGTSPIPGALDPFRWSDPTTAALAAGDFLLDVFAERWTLDQRVALTEGLSRAGRAGVPTLDAALEHLSDPALAYAIRAEAAGSTIFAQATATGPASHEAVPTGQIVRMPVAHRPEGYSGENEWRSGCALARLAIANALGAVPPEGVVLVEDALFGIRDDRGAEFMVQWIGPGSPPRPTLVFSSTVVICQTPALAALCNAVLVTGHHLKATLEPAIALLAHIGGTTFESAWPAGLSLARRPPGERSGLFATRGHGLVKVDLSGDSTGTGRSRQGVT